MPVCFCTALYSMITIGNLKENQVSRNHWPFSLGAKEADLKFISVCVNSFCNGWPWAFLHPSGQNDRSGGCTPSICTVNFEN